MHLRKVFIASLVFFLTSCAGPERRDNEARQFNDEKFARAAQAIGTKDFWQVFVPAKGAGAELMSEASLRAGTGTPSSRSLVERLASQQTRDLRVVVVGTNDSIAALTLLDALERLKGTPFKSLTVAYVGSADMEKRLQEAATAVPAKLYFIKFP